MNLIEVKINQHGGLNRGHVIPGRKNLLQGAELGSTAFDGLNEIRPVHNLAADDVFHRAGQ